MNKELEPLRALVKSAIMTDPAAAIMHLDERISSNERRLDGLEEVVAQRVIERVSNPVPWWARLLELRRPEDQRAFKALVAGFLAGMLMAVGAVLCLLP
jgi:hypothetical protein